MSCRLRFTMHNYTQLLQSVQLLLLLLSSVASSDPSNSSNSSCQPTDDVTYRFGANFLSETGARGPMTMLLPEDSDYRVKQRLRRHVVCGKTKSNRKPKGTITYEQRAICPFRHTINRNENRIPVVLEEVKCECDRPSHLSAYSEVRCEPVIYRIPVLIRNPESGEYRAEFEELTMACIPVVPKASKTDFEMHQLS